MKNQKLEHENIVIKQDVSVFCCCLKKRLNKITS